MPRGRIVAIVGATATGKTALAESLAERLDAEVVCADSRQVFRELEIGTGKPTPAERASRPHHLFEGLSLGESASAGWYGRAAQAVCADIHARGRMALLVGGSGLYLRAARSGLSPAPPSVPGIRARLRAELRDVGPEALHRRLATCDPETAARLEPRDAQRITRALEVCEASGRPLSWWHRHPGGPTLDADWQVIEIVVPPRALAERIARRTRALFDEGLVEETRGLVEGGLLEELRRLRAVGYDEALALIAGRLTRAEAEERTNARTRQLAKRQRTWSRHQVEAHQLEGGPDRLLRDALETVQG